MEPQKIHTVVISTQHAEPLKAVRSKVPTSRDDVVVAMVVGVGVAVWGVGGGGGVVVGVGGGVGGAVFVVGVFVVVVYFTTCCDSQTTT